MRKEDTRDYFSLFSFLVISYFLPKQAWRDLATAYLIEVLDKIILSQRFGGHIGYLIMDGNGVYLDHAQLHILSEVMVDDIDCLSVWAHLWEAHNFWSTRVIFECLALYSGIGTDSVIAMVIQLIN